MNTGKTLLAQIMEFVPWTSFARIGARHGGHSRVRSLSCTEQFAQLTPLNGYLKVGQCIII